MWGDGEEAMRAVRESGKRVRGWGLGTVYLGVIKVGDLGHVQSLQGVGVRGGGGGRGPAAGGGVVRGWRRGLRMGQAVIPHIWVVGRHPAQMFEEKHNQSEAVFITAASAPHQPASAPVPGLPVMGMNC